MNPSRLSTLTLALLAFPAAAQARAREICYDYDVVPAEDYADEDTSWYHITNNGDMVGNFCSSTDPTACTAGYDSLVWGAIYHAEDGEVEWFLPPDGYNVVQRAGMNEPGTVVGTAIDGNGAGGVSRAAAFMLVDGVATVFDDPTGYGYYAATDINAEGWIAGYSRDDSTFPNGRIGWILYPDGTYDEVEVPGAYRTFPFAINNNGDVAGYYIDGTYGFNGAFIRWADGEMELLTTVDGFFTDFTEVYAYGINNKGTVVGVYVDWIAMERGAFYWPAGGEMEKVRLAGYTYTNFDSINDRGTISGDTVGPADGIVVERGFCR